MGEIRRELKIGAYLGAITDKYVRSKYEVIYSFIQPLMCRLPGSTKYHHMWTGGLYDHTQEVIELAMEVFYRDEENHKRFGFTISDVVISAFIHDFDKLRKYKQDPTDPAKWIYADVPAASSVAVTVNILSHYDVSLSDIQLNALTFAEGGWSVEARGNPKAQPHPLAVIIHMADLYSTYFYGYKHEPGFVQNTI